MSNLATITNNILADSGIDDINVVVTTGSYSNPAWITALAWTKITGTPTTLAGYGITDAFSEADATQAFVLNQTYSSQIGGAWLSGYFKTSDGFIIEASDGGSSISNKSQTRYTSTSSSSDTSLK